MAKDALHKAVASLLGVIEPGKEAIAEAFAAIPAPSLTQRSYLWKTLKRYEFTLRMLGLKLPPEPVVPPALPGEPHFVDFLTGKFILRLSDAQAEQIEIIPKARHDKKTGLYSVPYRMQPTLSLHTFIKDTGVFCTEAAKSAILEMYKEMKERYHASRAKDAELDMEGFGLPLDPFQKAGIKSAIRFKRGFIADGMGLGKTHQGLGLLYKIRPFPAVVICPNSVLVNWNKKANTAFGGKLRIWRAKSRSLPKHTCAQKQLSLLDMNRWDDSCELCQFYQADLIIINYQKLAIGWKCQFDESGKKIKGRKREKGERAEVQLSEVAAAIKARGLRCIEIDESHYCKNETTQQTKATKELAQGCEYRVALSGTPIKNRPAELAPQLSILDRLDDLGGHDYYHRRFCLAAEKNGKYDTSGSAEEGELNKLLRATGFVQRNKRDVKEELPPIRHSVVWVEIDNRDEYERVEKDVVNWCAEQAVLKEEFLAMLKNLSPDDQADAVERKQIETRMRVMRAQAMVRVMALKKVAAFGKLNSVIEWVTDFLESGNKLVIFAHHRELQYALQKKFGCLHIFGKDNAVSRDATKEIFQGERKNDSGLSDQSIVCSFIAAREGIDLDASDDILRVEQPWTPADEDQAVARVDRFRPHNINDYQILADETIEVKINKLLEEKRYIMDMVVKGECDAETAAQFNVFDELFKELTGMSARAPSRESVQSTARSWLGEEVSESIQESLFEDSELFEEAIPA